MELVTERDQREVQGISGADFGTSELICPINMIINGFHFPYMAIPLKETEKMRIGYVKRKGASISHIGQIYIEKLKKYKEKIM